MPEYRIELFALLRDRAGAKQITIDEPAATLSPTELLARIAVVHDTLTPLLPYCRVAVNRVFCQSETRIHPTDEVALLPPVSGG